jgi:hypothetical protein
MLGAMSIPTFAIVGAVNHGKSSVVATLAEDDRVEVGSMPGTTVETQCFTLRDLFRFYDTPGFQNPIEALAELRGATTLTSFADFLTRHRGDADFEAECRLLQPIVDGAGVLYVVDGSEPVIELHRAEMEILRLTGQPRLAVVNRTRRDDHRAEWKRVLGQHFNAVREFDAHRATFAERVELLETLAGIEQAWKPKLMQVVQVFRADRAAKLDECAEIIVELLVDALTHSERRAPDSAAPAHVEHAAAELRERFLDALSRREAKAHREFVRLFGHRFVKSEASREQLVGSDLFSDETWTALGLDSRQLIAAGAVGGAALGASVDVLTIGHTLLAGATIGGGLGAIAAWAVGKGRPQIKVKLPTTSALLPRALRVARTEIVVGPYDAENFPFVLLDRALAVVCYLANRAHARRDAVTLRAHELKDAMTRAGISTAQWDAATRNECVRACAEIRRNKLQPADRTSLRTLLRTQLGKLGDAVIEPGA